MNTLANEFTTGPGEYQLNESLIRNTISYPWAPTTTIQKGGGSVLDKNFTDVESEIKNITRLLTNNPQKKYVPGAEGEEHHSDSSVFLLLNLLAGRISMWNFGSPRLRYEAGR